VRKKPEIAAPDGVEFSPPDPNQFHFAFKGVEARNRWTQL
jgi:hypothetical protein